jgi:hypothetical protein
MGARTAPGSGLAATVYNVLGKIQIRVFYQGKHRLFQYAIRLLKNLTGGADSHIRELVHEGGPSEKWSVGKLDIKDALVGTSLAAVTRYSAHEVQTSVFFQAHDTSLKNYRHDVGGWHEGQFIISPTESHPSDHT